MAMTIKEILQSTKVLIAGTAALVAMLLICGLFYPESFIMRLADTSVEYAVLRGIMVGILLAILLSRPPRSLVFRYVLLAMAAIFSLLSIGMLLTYKMNLLDAVMFIEVSIIFVLEALELQPKATTKPKIASRRVRIPVTSDK